MINTVTRDATPNFLLSLLLYLTLLTTASHGYVTYNEPPSSHHHSPTVHKYPSIPSSHAGPPLFTSNTIYTSNITNSYQLNLYLGPIGNLHLCNAVHFYDSNGRPIEDPPPRGLRGGGGTTSVSQADDPPPSIKHQSLNLDPTERHLALLIDMGGECTSVDKIHNALEANSLHAQEGGPRVRFILLYDEYHSQNDNITIDRDDVTLQHNQNDEDDLWIIYMGRDDGNHLRRLIEHFGTEAYPTLNRYPPFLLNKDPFRRQSPWQFTVKVDGNYLNNKPMPKPKPKPKPKPQLEWKEDDEEEDDEEL